jgi:hypothetical protein
MSPWYPLDLMTVVLGVIMLSPPLLLYTLISARFRHSLRLYCNLMYRPEQVEDDVAPVTAESNTVARKEGGRTLIKIIKQLKEGKHSSNYITPITIACSRHFKSFSNIHIDLLLYIEVTLLTSHLLMSPLKDRIAT